MLFAKRVFLFAGVVGLIVLCPLFFLESKIDAEQPPDITHPEFFYGFVGVGIAWQLAFLVIGTDPARYRPLMIVSVVEKASFSGAVFVLYGLGRVAASGLIFAGFDFTLGVLFAVSYLKIRPSS